MWYLYILYTKIHEFAQIRWIITKKVKSYLKKPLVNNEQKNI